MLYRVVLGRTDVSEERIISVVSVTRATRRNIPEDRILQERNYFLRRTMSYFVDKS
jgi:hypothetical protein